MGAASLRRSTIANAGQLPLPRLRIVNRLYIKYHAFAIFCLFLIPHAG